MTETLLSRMKFVAQKVGCDTVEALHSVFSREEKATHMLWPRVRTSSITNSLTWLLE